ncbi:hypothetical protein JCM21531_3878 [Acetivibrio straminisolvens JCM 21531]|uniref:Zinc-ribbon domain-containing protein n=1 Tax=Acetivibrio straminisolvens JCM 21531 TaxID=1294263 RepID=W4VBW5_9FIRM|nr:hypothetical protein JCM21531_3878 [Acetivibrio straminisolvens JCM 21531]
MAINITAHGPFGIGFFFPLFGIIFIFFGIVQAMYHYKNATGKDRFSIFDITESHEEGDPGTQWIRQANDELSQESKNGISNDGFRFCPYCGNSLGSDYNFCPKCGKAIS